MKLKQLREKKQISQTKLVEDLKIARTTYNGYETGRSEPDLNTLCMIADYYKVSLDYLCDHEIQDNIDTSAFSYTKKECVAKIKELNEDNANVLLGYLTHILQTQKNK